MALFNPADAVKFVNDAPTPATIGATTGKVWLQYPETMETFKGGARAGEVVRRPQIYFQTASPLGALVVRGAALTIAGVGYTVRTVQVLDEGDFSTAELSKP